jgi:hypothetical protein
MVGVGEQFLVSVFREKGKQVETFHAVPPGELFQSLPRLTAFIRGAKL